MFWCGLVAYATAQQIAWKQVELPAGLTLTGMPIPSDAPLGTPLNELEVADVGMLYAGRVQAITDVEEGQIWEHPSFSASLISANLIKHSGTLFPYAVEQQRILPSHTGGNVSLVRMIGSLLIDPEVRSSRKRELLQNISQTEFHQRLRELGLENEANSLKELAVLPYHPRSMSAHELREEGRRWLRKAPMHPSSIDADGHGLYYIEINDSILNGTGPSWVLYWERRFELLPEEQLVSLYGRLCGQSTSIDPSELSGSYGLGLTGHLSHAEKFYSIRSLPNGEYQSDFCLLNTMRHWQAEFVNENKTVDTAISGFMAAGALR